MSGLRTVYLGTSDFAVAVLRRLADSPHRPALVVTPPDRPKGRGRRLASPPVAEAARDLDLELLQAAGVNEPEAAERIRAAEPDVGVVCAFGQLIREPLLSELEMLNVHPSLLPRWRGAAPIERTIMAGDEETGVSVMRVTEGLDSGPVALQEATPINPGEDFGSLSARLADLGGGLIVEALDRQAVGSLDLEDQDDALATYAEKIGPEDRRLDPRRPAAELERVVRGLTPHVGAYVEFQGGERLGVVGATAEERVLGPGETEAGGGMLRIGCAEGALRLDVVQPSGKRPMSAADYLRGHPAPPPVVA